MFSSVCSKAKACSTAFLDVLEMTGVFYEFTFRYAHELGLPQYRYITRPVYDFCRNKVGTVAATAISVATVDFVCHQLIGKAIVCATQESYPAIAEWTTFLTAYDCSFGYHFKPMILVFTVPLMYVKYKRNQEKKISKQD